MRRWSRPGTADSPRVGFFPTDDGKCHRGYPLTSHLRRACKGRWHHDRVYSARAAPDVERPGQAARGRRCGPRDHGAQRKGRRGDDRSLLKHQARREARRAREGRQGSSRRRARGPSAGAPGASSGAPEGSPGAGNGKPRGKIGPEAEASQGGPEAKIGADPAGGTDDNVDGGDPKGDPSR